MTGLEYEHHVARYLTGRGYHGVKVTKGSGDYGVDVIAHRHGKKYAVQCKLYSGSVGLSAVQEAVAGKAMYNCDSAMVVTNSTFTRAAHELAKANGVILIENIKANRNHLLPTGLRAILWLAYLFVASAILYATVDVVKGQPILKATYNVISTVAVVTFPLWIKPASKGVWHLMKTIVCRVKHKDNALTDLPPQNCKPPVIARKTFADPATVKACLPGDIIAADFVAEGLCELEQVTVSAIQRKCKFGFTKASQILETLSDHGLLASPQVSVYEWTDKAK